MIFPQWCRRDWGNIGFTPLLKGAIVGRTSSLHHNGKLEHEARLQQHHHLSVPSYASYDGIARFAVRRGV
ncbi:MAG: hypothetical protein ABH878_07405 [bacterium]